MCDTLLVLCPGNKPTRESIAAWQGNTALENIKSYDLRLLDPHMNYS